MNVAGMLFGLGAALALLAAAATLFVRSTTRALAAGGASLVGVAVMCLALGSDFVAAAVALLLGVAVPAVAISAGRLAPPPADDHRPGPLRLVAVAVFVVALFAALGWLLTQTAWPPSAGPRDLTAPWLGWRLLTDDLLALVLLLGLLGVAGIAATALLRARAPRARRQPPEAA